ncbi:MAG: hypothetical protein ACOC0E_10495 [Spirochaetota bacterium]
MSAPVVRLPSEHLRFELAGYCRVRNERFHSEAYASRFRVEAPERGGGDETGGDR